MHRNYKGWTYQQEYMGPWKVWVALKNGDPEQGQIIAVSRMNLFDDIDAEEE